VFANYSINLDVNSYTFDSVSYSSSLSKYMARGCCATKFTHPIKSTSRFFADLITHFYSHRIKDCSICCFRATN